MDGALALRVPLMSGEVPQSFLSRLAARNGVTAERFCSHMRIDLASVANGDPVALSRLAQLGGVHPDALRRDAMVRGAAKTWTVRGESVAWDMLRRRHLRVCPSCLAEDITSSDLAPHEAAYCRTTWLVDQVRTCPVHEVVLVPLPKIELSGLHDFARRFRRAGLDVAGLRRLAVRRRPTPLEAYAALRLDGLRASTWLDGLALRVVLMTAERLGAVVLFGPRCNMRGLDEHAWRAAGSVGFEVLEDGQAGLKCFIEAMKPPGGVLKRSNAGTQEAFGGLWSFLRRFSTDPAFEPVCDAFARQLARSRPVRPAREILGIVPEAGVHTLATAAKVFGTHQKTLRRALAASDVLPHGHERLPPSQVFFDAAEATATIAALKQRMSLMQARNHINAPNSITGLLAKAGLITLVGEDRRLKGQKLFLLRDSLDAFLERVRAGAVDRIEPGPGEVNMLAAALAARRSVAEVTRLVVDGRLGWVGNLASERGFMAVLVRVSEVIDAFGEPPLPGLTKWEVGKRLKLPYVAVRHLIDDGLLQAQVTRQQRMESFYDVVQPAALERFDAEYVSAGLLASETAVHHIRLRSRLSAAGCTPALSPDRYGCFIYRRDEVSADLSGGVRRVTSAS